MRHLTFLGAVGSVRSVPMVLLWRGMCIHPLLCLALSVWDALQSQASPPKVIGTWCRNPRNQNNGFLCVIVQTNCRIRDRNHCRRSQEDIPNDVHLNFHANRFKDQAIPPLSIAGHCHNHIATSLGIPTFYLAFDHSVETNTSEFRFSCL